MEELQFLLEQLNKYGPQRNLTVQDLKDLVKAAIKESEKRGNNLVDIKN